MGAIHKPKALTPKPVWLPFLDEGGSGCAQKAMNSPLADGCQYWKGVRRGGPSTPLSPREAAGDSGSSCLWEEGAGAPEVVRE